MTTDDPQALAAWQRAAWPGIGGIKWEGARGVFRDFNEPSTVFAPDEAFFAEPCLIDDVAGTYDPSWATRPRDKMEAQRRLATRPRDEMEAQRRLATRPRDEMEAQRRLATRPRDEMEAQRRLATRPRDEMEAQRRLATRPRDEMEAHRRFLGLDGDFVDWPKERERIFGEPPRRRDDAKWRRAEGAPADARAPWDEYKAKVTVWYQLQKELKGTLGSLDPAYVDLCFVTHEP